MLPPNRAADLLRRIHKETSERAQASILPPIVAQALVALGLFLLFLVKASIVVYALALVVGQTVVAGLAVATMARLERIVARGLVRASRG